MNTSPLDMEAELRGTPYAHLRPLALGGMGEVHVVKHLALREERVMKIVRVLDQDVEADIAKRTLTEGRTLRALRHPNIVELLDLGLSRNGRPYLITELLHGRTLKEEVSARGPLPWPEVLAVLQQLLSGLQVAHDQGIVHRDIKPLNVFYCEPTGQAARSVKILDFGIAKIVSASARERAGSALVATRTGFFIGSPAFMPPEQVIGGSVDARADLYALGVLGYFLLTAENLFSARSSEEMMKHHLLEEAPRASRKVAGLPEVIDDVLWQALRKNPNERFDSAEVMLKALVSTASEPASRVVAPMPSTEPMPQPPLTEATVYQAPMAALPSAPLPAAVLAEPAEERTQLQTEPRTQRATARGGFRAVDSDEEARERRRQRWLLLVCGALLVLIAVLSYLLLLGAPKDAAKVGPNVQPGRLRGTQTT